MTWKKLGGPIGLPRHCRSHRLDMKVRAKRLQSGVNKVTILLLTGLDTSNNNAYHAIK